MIVIKGSSLLLVIKVELKNTLSMVGIILDRNYFRSDFYKICFGVIAKVILSQCYQKFNKVEKLFFIKFHLSGVRIKIHFQNHEKVVYILLIDDLLLNFHYL